jgi:hypothetical protein
MTKVQATCIQATWNQLGSQLCEHLKVDLERSEDGYVTGTYRCIACGYANTLSPLPAHPYQPMFRMNVTTV